MMAFNSNNSPNKLYSPKLILVFSGKRKSGKDYICDTLLRAFSNSVCIIRLSGPLKESYALEKGLDYAELMNSSSYKENFRADMITWGEEKRKSDPFYFCNKAIFQNEAKVKNAPVWIVSDARRTTDLNFFLLHFPKATKTVKISSNIETRMSRGFKYTSIIDDAESECGLDKYINWDFNIINNQDGTEFLNSVQQISNLISQCL